MNDGANALENDGLADAEFAGSSAATGPTSHGRVQRLGRLRLPIAGAYRPWATAYRLPDGRVLWCVRLWQVDRPRVSCVATSTLRMFCRLNHFPELAAEMERLVRR
jgi:hypothetical protein